MTTEYIHGVTESEQSRLSLLNDLLNERCVGVLDLRPGMRVLDIGSGLGQLSRAIARGVSPGGHVVGVERDETQRASAARLAETSAESGLVEFRAGDALSPPLSENELGSFDLAHTRFVLEHIPDPVRVVRRMRDAVRPGGRVAIADDNHELWTMSPACTPFMDAWRAYIRLYELMDLDPRVGTNLVTLLHEAGLRPSRIEVLTFGACAGNPHFPAFVENAAGVLVGARERLISAGLLTADQVDEGIGAIHEWGALPDAALWYPLCWAEGVRPE